MEEKPLVSESAPAMTEQESAGEKSVDKIDEGGTFLCSQCRLEERFDYKGTRPAFSKKVVFLEESYVMKDPFTGPDKQQFLLLGADCSVCRKAVCQAQECSVFYVDRFCTTCGLERLAKFPSQIQAKLKKVQATRTF